MWCAVRCQCRFARDFCECRPPELQSLFWDWKCGHHDNANTNLDKIHDVPGWRNSNFENPLSSLLSSTSKREKQAGTSAGWWRRRAVNVNGRQAPNWQWQQLIVLTGSRNEDEWINDLPTAAHKQRYQRTTNSLGISTPRSPAFSSACPRTSHTSSQVVPSLLYWRRWLLLLVKSCNWWLAASSPVFGKPSWSLVKWSDPKSVTKKLFCEDSYTWKLWGSYRCVLTGSADPSLRRHPRLCHGAVLLSPSCLPFSPCFISQFHPPVICHVERTCRQNRAHCGTAFYLNPLMGSMGSEVLLGHWFKASLICLSNKPLPREQRDTLPFSSCLSASDILSAVYNSSCLSCCPMSKNVLQTLNSISNVCLRLFTQRFEPAYRGQCDLKADSRE